MMIIMIDPLEVNKIEVKFVELIFNRETRKSFIEEISNWKWVSSVLSKNQINS